MRNMRDVMSTVPANPNLTFDKKEQEKFRKRVNEVISKVETDVGSGHLFEPASDVIRRKRIYAEVREEIAEAIFTEYKIIREHAGKELELKGYLAVLEGNSDLGEGNAKSSASETEFESFFFDCVERLLKKIYEEVAR